MTNIISNFTTMATCKNAFVGKFFWKSRY